MDADSEDAKQTELQTAAAHLLSAIAAKQNQPFTSMSCGPATASPPATAATDKRAATASTNAASAAGEPSSVDMFGLCQSMQQLSSTDEPSDNAIIIPKWAALSKAVFTDTVTAAVRVCLTLGWLAGFVQAQRRQQSPHILQQHRQLQQALLLALAELITGHMWNSKFGFYRIVKIELGSIFWTWQDLYEAKLTTPTLDSLMLAVLRRLHTDPQHFQGMLPQESLPFQDACLPLIWQCFCKYPELL